MHSWLLPPPWFPDALLIGGGVALFGLFVLSRYLP